MALRLATIPLIALATFSASCSVFDSEYRDYNDDDDKTSSPTTTATLSAECDAAQTIFVAKISGDVDANCAKSGCHLTQTISGKPLIAGNAANNRAQLKAYAKGSADTLYGKYSATTTSHTGGSLKDGIVKASLDEWYAKEVLCK